MYNEYKTLLKATSTRFLNEVPFSNKLTNGKLCSFLLGHHVRIHNLFLTLITKFNYLGVY